MPFAQLLGHRASRGREGKHLWHVQSIPQRHCVLDGGLGPSGLLPVWSLGQATPRSPVPRENSGPMRSGGRLSLPLAPQLGKLRLREDDQVGWLLALSAL